MTQKTLLRGGTVITPAGSVAADVLSHDGTIVAIGRTIEADPQTQVIDVAGLMVLPGVIDAHSHLWEAGFMSGPDFTDSTASAAAGGITTVIDMPLTVPEVLNGDLLIEKARLGEATSHIDFALHAGVSPDNLSDLQGMWNAGATAFKIFTCETGCPMAGVIDDGDLHEALSTIAGFGGLATFHAENDALLKRNFERLSQQGRTDNAAFSEWRSELVELEAIQRIALFAEFTGARVNMVHITSRRAVETALEARSRGVSVTVETCPHYLYLTAEDIASRGAWVTCAPPMRGRDYLEDFRRLVADGTIQTIGSDHGPVDPELKRRGDNNIFQGQPGLPGNETMVPLLLNLAAEGVLTIERVAEVLSTSPAKLYGLYPRKGTIAVGSDADFTVVDPHAAWVIRAADLVGKSGWTPYEGLEVRGRVASTIVRGRVVARDGRVCGDLGLAHYVPRNGVLNPLRPS